MIRPPAFWAPDVIRGAIYPEPEIWAEAPAEPKDSGEAVVVEVDAFPIEVPHVPSAYTDPGGITSDGDMKAEPSAERNAGDRKVSDVAVRSGVRAFGLESENREQEESQRFPPPPSSS